MAKKATDNLKLGSFVIAGGIFLVILLYMIGRKENLFGNTFLLKARFTHVQGLMAGNNVRFAGIQVGTVKSVSIVNDSTIEVVMRIETDMKKHLRKNAVASIGTEGLIGNKVVNIVPGKTVALPIEADDILQSSAPIDTDDMMHTLEKTNHDIGVIATELKLSAQRLRESTALWRLLNDESLPANLSASLSKLKQASIHTENLTNTLDEIVTGIQSGKGTLGTMISDTMLAYELQETLIQIKSIGNNAAILSASIHKTVDKIDNELNNGKGMAHALMKDSSLTENLSTSLRNIEKGTAAFNENMEALKHNFLFRGYFRRLERQQKKQR